MDKKELIKWLLKFLRYLITAILSYIAGDNGVLSNLIS